MTKARGPVAPEIGRDRIADALQAFEDRDRAGAQISLEEVWDARGPDDPVEALAALVKADLRRRYARGERPAVSEYLARFPDLQALRDRVVSLVYEEYCLREERGEAPDPGHFCDRYEPWRDSLESQLRYHRMLSQVAGVPAPRPRFPAPGERFGGKFRLGEILGEGGDATVYVAHEEDVGDRQVALKVARDRGREPAILGRLDHPNIVSVLTVCREEGRGLRGISMPYRPGQPLHEVIRRIDPAVRNPRGASALWEAASGAGPIGEGAGSERPGWEGFPRNGTYAEGVAWIIMTLARALAHAHGRGILHCDVKPANILLTVRDGPQLLDFNLAQDPHAAEQAEAALHGGTLPYMAPEQLHAFLDPGRRDEVGPPADLFALGLVLVELLTGHRPDPPDADLPMARAIGDLIDRRSLRPTSPRALVATVPHALDAIAARCLAALPAARYAHADELAEDLRHFLDRRPARHAPNPSSRERFGLWLRRNGIGLALALVLLAIAPAGARWARLALLERRAASAPDSATAHVNLGIALEDAGRTREARAQYELAMKAPDAAQAIGRGTRDRPRSAALQTFLGMVLIRGPSPRWDEARAAFLAALRIDPRLDTAHHGLAYIAEVHDHDPEEAASRMTAALRIAESPGSGSDPGKVAEFRRLRAISLVTLAGNLTRSGLNGSTPPRRAGDLLEEALEELRRVRVAWGREFARLGKVVEPKLRATLEIQTANAEMGLGDLSSSRGDYGESVASYLEGLKALDRAAEILPATSQGPTPPGPEIATTEALRRRLGRDTPRLWRLIFGVETPTLE